MTARLSHNRDMENVPNMQVAIEGLYEAFSAYPLPDFTDPCLHCHTLEDEAKLRSSPLRQLSAADLESYADDALTVWGGVDDFKHFLPRIFDLYFSEGEPRFQFLDPEILFSKLRRSQWLTWKTPEQSAVRQLLHSLWHEILGDPPPSSSFTDVQSWLCSIAQAEDDLNPYLEAWLEDQRTSASFALSSMVLSDAGRNAFWDGRESQYAQLQSWRSSRGVVTKLEQALASAESVSAKNEFAAALGSVTAVDS
jgi:hypothetical protein